VEEVSTTSQGFYSESHARQNWTTSESAAHQQILEWMEPEVRQINAGPEINDRSH
jgi:hypothetical protein